MTHRDLLTNIEGVMMEIGELVKNVKENWNE